MNTQTLIDAIHLAVAAHGDQLDKGGLPYILHPLHVMDTVDGIDAKIVAVLHDVVEDTAADIGTTRDCIVFQNYTYYFSPAIIEAIDAITKRNGEKKEIYWARVKANPLALQVKLADIAHNTSEARLAVLPLEEANYLRGKYAKALKFFHEND